MTTLERRHRAAVPTGSTGRGRPRAGRAPDRGSATAETAVALPALVLVLAVCVSALTLLSTALRVGDAARAAARAAARGDPPERVADAARRASGRAVTVATRRDGELLTVTVTARAAPLPLARRILPAMTIARDATALAEPNGAPP